jgi:hypothetical protein
VHQIGYAVTVASNRRVHLTLTYKQFPVLPPGASTLFAVQYIAVKGVEFVKKPEDGKMKGIAFVKDADAYWIEILTPNNADMIINWPANDE